MLVDEECFPFVECEADPGKLCFDIVFDGIDSLVGARDVDVVREGDDFLRVMADDVVDSQREKEAGF